MASENTFVLPEGRGINLHLFVRTQYQDENGPQGALKYQAECAYGKEVEAESLEEFKDFIFERMCEAYGEDYMKDKDENGHIIWPIKDGDALAERREKKGKEGKAYRDMWVIRASNQFNKDGDPADGGIAVYDKDVKDILPAKKSLVYNGCRGEMAVSVKPYTEVNKMDDIEYVCAALYVEAFQLTNPGERLTAQTDKRQLFKPKSGSGSGGSTRRSR